MSGKQPETQNGKTRTVEAMDIGPRSQDLTDNIVQQVRRLDRAEEALLHYASECTEAAKEAIDLARFIKSSRDPDLGVLIYDERMEDLRDTFADMCEEDGDMDIMGTIARLQVTAAIPELIGTEREAAELSLRKAQARGGSRSAMIAIGLIGEKQMIQSTLRRYALMDPKQWRKSVSAFIYNTDTLVASVIGGEWRDTTAEVLRLVELEAGPQDTSWQESKLRAPMRVTVVKHIVDEEL